MPPKKQSVKAAKPTRAVATKTVKKPTCAATSKPKTKNPKAITPESTTETPTLKAPVISHPPMDEMDTGQIIEVLTKAMGNIAHAARLMRTTRKNLMTRIIEDAAIEDAYTDIKEGLVDAVETALYASAVKGNVRAQELWLTRHPIAVRRGWGVSDSPPVSSTSQHLHMHMNSNGEASEDVTKAIASASIETLKEIQRKLSYFAVEKITDPIVIEAQANDHPSKK